MDVNSKFALRIPFQLTNTLAAGRHSLPGRGLDISRKIIKIEVESSQEEISKAAEARANQLLGRKVDEVV